MRPLTHSQVTHAHMVEYLDDVSACVSRNANSMSSSSEFKAIYKTSLAAFVTLKSFSRGRLRLVRSAAELCRRIPVLIVSGQVAEATASLRRFVEVVAWFPFFADHPVEWQHLQAEPLVGYTRYEDNPIAYAAHREIGYYFAYIAEKSSCTANSVLGKALNDLQTGFKETSKAVHAGALAAHDVTVEPFDELTPSVLKALGSLQRSLFRAGIVVVAWSLPQAVHRLQPVERSWFDWLLKNWSHATRSGALA